VATEPAFRLIAHKHMSQQFIATLDRKLFLPSRVYGFRIKKTGMITRKGGR
jgi:hypothetical protein